MSSPPLSAAARAHWKALRAMGGISVQYVQDGASTPLVAVPGRTEFLSEDMQGAAMVTAKSRDYLVLAADLPGTPKRGDRIVESGNTYELMSAGDGRWYSEADHYGVIYRLRTKLLEVT